MKNLNEEINRIKTIISINEQCDGDLDQCAQDLEDKDYKVFTPEQLETNCENNTIISCVNSALDSNSIPDLLISSAGESTKNCFVLAKGNKKEAGIIKLHFSFYGDSQLVVTLRLNSHNGFKKLLYSGTYDCSGTNITFSNLKYKGVSDGGKTTFENVAVLKSDGTEMQVNATQSNDMDIDEGVVMIKDYLTVWFYAKAVSQKNVLKVPLTDTEVYKILKI